jgi:hypothetical protein
MNFISTPYGHEEKTIPETAFMLNTGLNFYKYE